MKKKTLNESQRPNLFIFFASFLVVYYNELTFFCYFVLRNSSRINYAEDAMLHRVDRDI